MTKKWSLIGVVAFGVYVVAMYEMKMVRGVIEGEVEYEEL